jgi:hypothetical protein
MNLKELTNSIPQEVFVAISLIRKCPKPKLAFALNPIWVEVLELAGQICAIAIHRHVPNQTAGTS